LTAKVAKLLGQTSSPQLVVAQYYNQPDNSISPHARNKFLRVRLMIKQVGLILRMSCNLRRQAKPRRFRMAKREGSKKRPGERAFFWGGRLALVATDAEAGFVRVALNRGLDLAVTPVATANQRN